MSDTFRRIRDAITAADTFELLVEADAESASLAVDTEPATVTIDAAAQPKPHVTISVVTPTYYVSVVLTHDGVTRYDVETTDGTPFQVAVMRTLATVAKHPTIEAMLTSAAEVDDE